MSFLLSVVLPCYNPPATWESDVMGFYNDLKGIADRHDIQIILVNDGSTKNLDPRIINRLQKSIAHFEFISYPLNQGKGHALRKGITQATGKYIIYTDIDIPYTFNSFRKIYDALATHQVAVGVRNNSYYHKIPKARLLISKILKSTLKIFFRLKTYDTQGGLKGMTQELRPVFLACKTNRYLFDLEFIFMASKANKDLLEVEVNLKDGVLMRKMNWKIIFQELWSLAKIYLHL